MGGACSKIVPLFFRTRGYYCSFLCLEHLPLLDKPFICHHPIFSPRPPRPLLIPPLQYNYASWASFLLVVLGLWDMIFQLDGIRRKELGGVWIMACWWVWPRSEIWLFFIESIVIQESFTLCNIFLARLNMGSSSVGHWKIIRAHSLVSAMEREDYLAKSEEWYEVDQRCLIIIKILVYTKMEITNQRSSMPIGTSSKKKRKKKTRKQKENRDHFSHCPTKWKQEIFNHFLSKRFSVEGRANWKENNPSTIRLSEQIIFSFHLPLSP